MEDVIVCLRRLGIITEKRREVRKCECVEEKIGLAEKRGIINFSTNSAVRAS